MRKSKPGIGYSNMRKITSSEAKLLRLSTKIMIMANEAGVITFWLRKGRSNDVIRFTGPIDEYFDEDLANTRLEQYWSKYCFS